MESARKQLQSVITRANKELKNTNEYRALEQANQARLEAQKNLTNTQQGQRLSLLETINNRAGQIIERWETGFLFLGLSGGAFTLAATVKTAIEAPHPPESLEGFLLLITTMTLSACGPTFLGLYTGQRFGNARAERFINKEDAEKLKNPENKEAKNQ